MRIIVGTGRSRPLRSSSPRLAIARLGRPFVLGVAITFLGCGSEPRPPSGKPTKGSPTTAPAQSNESTSSIDDLAGREIAIDRAGFDSQPESRRPSALVEGDSQPGVLRFSEVAAESGIDFVHTSGTPMEKYSPTANGSGVAIFDYDNDGKLDLYFATGTFLPVGSRPTGTNRLFRNLGKGQFRDVTAQSGLGFAGYCYGIVVGDIDNDGDQDVFLCNYGPNALFLNDGTGLFHDISRSAGIDRPNWTSSGALLDYDSDGDLDLYLTNYADWKLPRDDVFCGDKARNIRIYCHPKWLRPTKHILFRNNGDRTFTEVTDAAGIGRSDGHGFGVVAADVNADGLIDLYVANDNDPNFLFLNRGDGTFEDTTLTSGAGLSDQGRAQAGMGVDAEDIDGDGLPDLYVSNFAGEYNTLYQNLGKGMFLDATSLLGLAADSIPWIGWGCGLIDFDGDTWPDCFVANGGVDDNSDLLGSGIPFAEPPLLYRNKEGRGFRLVNRGAGSYFDQGHVGHGVAFGDIDDDGDIDIVISHKDGRPALLRNDTPGGNHWVRLQLIGVKSNRDAIGARVEVIAGDRVIHRQRKGGSSLMSSHDPRLLVGLGRANTIAKLTVRWPRGAVSQLDNLAVDRTYRIVEPAVGDSPSPSPLRPRATTNTVPRKGLN
jgi:hypothetical protein